MKLISPLFPKKNIFLILPLLAMVLQKGAYAFDRSACLQGKSVMDTISTGSLLDEMVSLDAEACFPAPSFDSKLTTSYDRRSVIPGTPSWHANEDGAGFIRYEANNGRVEKVLFEQAGPGAITRIITTGKAAGTNLRIYFDDEPEASVTITGYDIAKFPIEIPSALLYKHEHYNTKQGSSFYYPLPYRKRCKITVDDLNRSYYFHANYRIYEPGTIVRTFNIAEAQSLKSKAMAISGQLEHPLDYAGNKLSAGKKIGIGSVVSLTLPRGPKAIRTLEFKVTGFTKENYGQLMRGLIVKLSFDGKQTVWAPLGDFSGAGMGAPEVRSYYISADGAGNVRLRFVMPYKNNATVSVENITAFTARVDIVCNSSDWEWKPGTLYFHTSWRQQRGLVTNAGLDYNMASLTGRGVFKGDALTLYNFSKRWYGEGDEHIWIDNENFPSHFGCGTEDYYNTTFAPIHVYHLPFGGAPREDDEASRGYNSFVRTRNLDIIPFREKLKFEFELISWDGGLVDYASTVYWYGDADGAALNTSTEREALSPLQPAIYTGAP